MRFERPARHGSGRVSLTPLIDVVFILLLFFMLASSFQQWRSLTLTTAGRESAGAAAEPPALHVGVRADGSARIEGRVHPGDSIGPLVRSLLAGDLERPVVVAPDGEVELQVLVDVLDRLTRAGVRHLTLGSG